MDMKFSSRLLGTEVTGKSPRLKLRTESAGEPLGTPYRLLRHLTDFALALDLLFRALQVL